ncbi:MAG: 16S rRNA (guanine(527)-N(7))-methyltransferase RsmG [Saprospiraceae bacterium]
MELIRKYFPELSEEKLLQFERLDSLYRNWNEKINVISRKDINHLYEHHVLHSLAIAKHHPSFAGGLEVLDFGTGGGFPGIPMAIMFPEVKFTLLDSMAKKIKVVSEIATELKLENVIIAHARAEDFKGMYDLIICRAVSTVSQTIAWSKHLVPAQKWIMLKGGDANEIRRETRPNYATKLVPVSQYFEELYFTEKYLVAVQKK